MKRKTIISLFLFCLVVILAVVGFNSKYKSDVLGVKASAETSGTCGENLTWTLDDEGTLTISGTGAMYNYYYWYSEAPWYPYRNNISIVVLENGVNSIGYYAFYDCYEIANITIPESVRSIGYRAFDGCSSLASINVDDNNSSYSSEEGILFNKTKTVIVRFPMAHTRTSYDVPESVTNIDEYAFYGCSSLININIPDSVRWVGHGAFTNTGYYNDELNWENGVLYMGKHLIESKTSITGSYTIKDGTKTIVELAFYGCDSLTSITIPESLTGIGSSAFYGCSFLTTVNFNAVNCNCVLLPGFSYCSALTTVNIGGNVETIPDNVFYGCSKITNITIPGSVTNIGNAAFAGCTSLTSITIPESVTNIGNAAFNGCSSITTVNYNAINCNTMGSYYNYVFSGCTALTSINIGENVENIPVYAFCDCSKIINITIPESVTNIGNSAFSDCSSLISITIQGNITSISSGAFSGCSSLTSITIPESVANIGDRAFNSCSSLTSITIPENVTNISDRAFADCSSLTTVNYNAINCNTVGNSVYEDCTALTTINIGENVETIPDYAFSGCSKITNISVSESVTSIGNRAFSGCSSLTNITIPENVKRIGYSAFSGCTALTTVNFNATNCISMGRSNNPVFGNCSSLTTINIGENVKSIPGYAFYDCTALTTINIPNGVTKIDFGAFCGCTSLASIYIPNTVTNIEDTAFYFCESLKDVYYEGKESDWNKIEIGTLNDDLKNAKFHFGNISNPGTGDTPDVPDDDDYSNAKLPVNTVQKANYKNNVTVNITATDLPANSFLVVNGKKTEAVNGRAIFETNFQATAGKRFKAHIEDANGNVKVAEKEYTVNVDTSFFGKLASFFTDFLFNGFKWKEVTVEF